MIAKIYSPRCSPCTRRDLVLRNEGVVIISRLDSHQFVRPSTANIPIKEAHHFSPPLSSLHCDTQLNGPPTRYCSRHSARIPSRCPPPPRRYLLAPLGSRYTPPSPLLRQRRRAGLNYRWTDTEGVVWDQPELDPGFVVHRVRLMGRRVHKHQGTRRERQWRLCRVGYCIVCCNR